MKRQLLHRMNPFLDMLKTGWENRDQLGYASRILRDGVCDGCALGTSGMKDWTLDGIHLCWIRLNLLRLNTMPAFDPTVLENLDNLSGHSEKELRQLGRLSQPMLRVRGNRGFKPIEWDEAFERMSRYIQSIDRKRLAFYLVSRGTVNETYYVAQKAARYLGTNHIDNSARICHAPSTTALKQTTGFAATTCSYKDMIGSDLVVFIGSNAANNQPVVMKYLHYAKKQGTRVAVINTFREPGMEKYWVPSAVDSALFGTRISDGFFRIKPGGDIAFINGVLKIMIAENWIDDSFIAERTNDWPRLVAELEKQTMDELEKFSGASRDSMKAFAKMYAQAKTAVFIWSMGITMHRHGVSNVKSIANLALAKGMVGRPKTGLMAIRGHSGVQGGAEVGAVPNLFPGGKGVNKENAEFFSNHWQFPVPYQRGYYAAEMIDAAWERKLDMLYCVGSNLFSVLPDSRYVRKAIQRIPFRVHHDIVLNQQMLIDPAEVVLLLPATTRYEMAGGNTETTTERRIIFNPEIPGRRISEARDEWRTLMTLAEKVDPANADKIHFESTEEIRREIAETVPLYAGIENFRQKGDQFQWGGERLGSDGTFGTADGKARFIPLSPPQRKVPAGWFQLSTRRGKQFNSIEFSDRDPLSNTRRNQVLMAPEDIRNLGFRDNDSVLLRSESGEMTATVRAGDVQPGIVIMYWPEANVLIRRGVCDPECGIPAYRDALVQVLKLPAKNGNNTIRT